ncbi:MAG: AMP-binding protein [Myxococcales bacterium]|nr:AMP-binding protein [Myxococcales bacterium]
MEARGSRPTHRGNRGSVPGGPRRLGEGDTRRWPNRDRFKPRSEDVEQPSARRPADGSWKSVRAGKGRRTGGADGRARRSSPTLRELLANSAQHGEREFLVYSERRMTFAEHRKAVAQLARTLEEKYEIGTGDRVAILGANSPEWM